MPKQQLDCREPNVLVSRSGKVTLPAKAHLTVERNSQKKATTKYTHFSTSPPALLALPSKSSPAPRQESLIKVVKLLRPLHLHELETFFKFLRCLEIKAIGPCYSTSERLRSRTPRQDSGPKIRSPRVQFIEKSIRAISDVEDEADDNATAAPLVALSHKMSWDLL
jgi:hypothetical protein